MDSKLAGFTRAVLTLVGALTILIGFNLPWFSEIFAPPGGTLTLSGLRVDAFVYSSNGFAFYNSDFANNSTLGSALHLALSSLFIIGLIELSELIPYAGTKQLIVIAQKVLHSQATKGTLSVLKLIAALILLWGWLGFAYLDFIGLSDQYQASFEYQLGGGSPAMQAAQYLNYKIGFGYWLTIIGIVIGGVGAVSVLITPLLAKVERETRINCIVILVFALVIPIACVFALLWVHALGSHT